MDPVLTACFNEIEKRAISPALTMRVLQGRMAQGARVAPAMMQRATQYAASGATRTAPTMRRMALDAGDAARQSQKAQALAPVKAPLQARIQQANAMGPAAFNQTPLRHHDAMGNTHGYSQAHINTIAGSRARVADPSGLTTPAPAPAQSGTVSAKRPRLAPAQHVDPSASTVVSGPPIVTRAA